MKKDKNTRPTYNQCVTTIPRIAFEELQRSNLQELTGIEIQLVQTPELENSKICKVKFRAQNTGETNFKKRLVTAITTVLTLDKQEKIHI